MRNLSIPTYTVLALLLTIPTLSSCFIISPMQQASPVLWSLSPRPFARCRSSSVRLLAKSDVITSSTLSDLSVLNTDGSSVAIESLMNGSGTTILACLSHFGDFNAWEVTQQYTSAVDAGDIGDDCSIVLVGIGSAESASKFASDLALEKYDSKIKLVADPKAIVTDSFDCYRGWLAVDKAHAKRWPATDVNPYVKLFGMIFGLGSPGTIEKVLYGYIGNKEGSVTSRKWVVDALLLGTEKGRWPKITPEAFDGVPADSGLRPFELATLRAQTGVYIVLNWSKLGPKDGDLFTRMGGTFVFRDNKCAYEWFDNGILTYAPIEDVLSAAKKE